MDNLKIGFYSNLMGAGVNHGYGYVAVQLIEAWQRLNIPVWTWDIDAPIGFNFVQPNWYEYVDGRANIGYTPWESTGVPKLWPHYMNQMTEVWTTCEANKQWYEDAGVKVPIRVLHHGINRNHWPRKRRTLDDGPIRFLTIGADAKRKGAHIAVEAFKAAFPNPSKAAGGQGVEMTLKAPKTWWDYKRTKGIHRQTTYLSHKQMTKLYHDHHVMFYPTSGEGFGLIPFDAMASGMPTWATNWSGPADFLEFGYGIPIKGLVDVDYEPHEGQWAEPDFDYIVDAMRNFCNYADDYFEASYIASGRMDAEWTWDALAQKSIDWMQEIILESQAC